MEKAIALANLVTELDVFYDAIRAKSEPFDSAYTAPDATPAVIAAVLMSSEIVVQVIVRNRTLVRGHNAYGWTYASDPETVYLNSRHLGGRTVADIAATLVHEWVHAVDATHELYFHHGDNSSVGKGNTAPYWIDRLATELVQKIQGSVGESETTPHGVADDAIFAEDVSESDLV